MASITAHALPTGCPPSELWSDAVDAAMQWLHERAIVPADAVFLVPFAELLTPARRAFVRRGDWMPRIHTTRTLTLALGPAREALAREFTGEPGVDALVATALLRGQTWADAWRRRDRRGFQAGVQQLVRMAQLLAEGARARLPAQRSAW
jgi:ATP-dependent helicase/nuclease subunit B